MPASKGAVKLSEKESSVNVMENKSKICIQPHFAKHTESSLRKTKIPIKLNKRSSTLEVKKLQENLSFSSLSGISKKRSKIMKQRQSMQALKTILKQEKQRRTSDLEDNKLTETIRQPKQYAENLLVSLQGDLIKYSSKSCAKSPAKSQALRDEVSSIRSLSVCPQGDIKSISDCSGDRTILNITCKLQSQTNNDEENFANSFDIEVLHRTFRLEKAIEKSTESIEPTNSIETIKPTELTKPTQCIESAESIELKKLTECIESAESIKLLESTESIKESIKLAELTEPIQHRLTEFTESIQHAEPIELADLTESTQLTESAEDCFNNELEEQLFQQNISMNLNAATNYGETQETLIKTKNEVENEPNLKLVRNSKFKTKHFYYSKNEDIKPIINSNLMLNKKKGVLQKNSVFTKAQQVWKPPGVKNSSRVENMYMISSKQPTLRKPFRSTKKYFPPTKNEYAESFDNELSASILTHQCNEIKENKDPCANRMTKICESLIELKQQQRMQITETSKRKKSANKGSKILKNYNVDNPERSKSESKSRYWQTRLIPPTKFSKTRNYIEQHHLNPNQISKKSNSLDVIHALKGIIKNMKEHEHADVNAVSISKDGLSNREEIEFLTLPNKKTFSKITRKNNACFTKYLNEANQSVNKSHKSVSTQTTLNSSLHLEIDSNNGLNSKEILKKSTQIVATQTFCSNKNVDIACNTTVCNVTCKNVGVFCDLIDSMNMKAKIDSTTIQNKSVLKDILIQTNESLSTESVEITNAGDKCPNDNEKTLSAEMSLKLNGMENDAQCEDMVVPELKVENIPRQVIADFELTAERARNFYEAIIIYRSLMSRKFEKRQEKYALELWNESLEINRRRNALELSATTEKLSISRENLLPFVYCVLCILLFWCLQF